MGFFDRLRKNTHSSSSPIWRTNTGKIECPGRCPDDCNDTCPIHCQTIAIEAFQLEGNMEKAIAYFRKALTLAPDFKDAWNNMAAVYGSMNNHLEANKAYKAAYMLDKNYQKALFGLIVSSKNLGQFEEALKYCDEYEQKFGKADADRLRSQVRALQSQGNVSRQETAVEMAAKIIAQARQDGTMGENNSMPHIPEIMGQSKVVCRTILQDLMQSKDGNRPDIWLAWGAYAGMGAVQHWHLDWDNLKKKGIAETLLEPRGSFAMDEYVVDIIGIGYETEEGKKFQQNIYNLAMWSFSKFMMDKSGEQMMESAFETMQAMYIFGMVLQMERLGMK